MWGGRHLTSQLVTHHGLDNQGKNTGHFHEDATQGLTDSTAQRLEKISRTQHSLLSSVHDVTAAMLRPSAAVPSRILRVHAKSYDPVGKSHQKKF